MDSDSELSINLDGIIVNFNVQRGHAVSPSHWRAFSLLFVSEAARNVGFQKEFVSFSVVLPAGSIDDKIDYVLKENP